MNCSDIISIVDIAISAGVGVWVATAINKGQTRERFLKDYFTNELIRIKEACKTFFDDICYDKVGGNDIKTGFKIISMRAKAYEDNVEEVFKNVESNIHQNITRLQVEITNSDEFNNQYKNKEITFGALQKTKILEERTHLLNAFSKAVITINKATIKRSIRRGRQ